MSFNKLTSLEKGMRLYGRKKTDPRQVRILKNDIENDFIRYADMFHKAGEQIAIHLLDQKNEDIYQLDTFFYPLTFIYRHCIELVLKAIGFKCITSKAERKNFINETFHNLKKIYDEVDKLYSVSLPQDQKDWVSKFLKNISMIDAASDSFRYPFYIVSEKDFFGNDTYSLQRLFEKQTNIDLVKLSYKFEAAFSILWNWYYETTYSSTKYQELSTVFLEEGGSYYSMAVVGYGYRKEDFLPYTDAYCETAGFLRNHMERLFEEAKYNEASIYFIPMCYLYRNCVELAEKAILFEETDKSIDEKCAIVNKYKHSIEMLWKSIKTDAYKCWSASEFPQTMALIEQYCAELHTFDPQAIRFRYPINRNIDLAFNENQWFDYGRTSEFFEGLINVFQGIEAELSEMRSIKAEMEAELELEMRDAINDYY